MPATASHETQEATGDNYGDNAFDHISRKDSQSALVPKDLMYSVIPAFPLPNLRMSFPSVSFEMMIEKFRLPRRS